MTASPSLFTHLTLRAAGPQDQAALHRLAALDSRRAPRGEVLVAEADGEIRAALRVSDSAYVADPFFPSRALVGLLDTRAKAMRRATTSRLDRARTRLSLWSDMHHRAAQTGPML